MKLLPHVRPRGGLPRISILDIDSGGCEPYNHRSIEHETNRMSRDSPVEIALAVVRHGDRVLIGQRPPGVPLAGYWEFPGGKVLADESPEEAAARECREETGLEIRVGVLLSLVEHEYPHGRVRLHFFAAEPLQASRTPTAPFGWIPIAELASYRFPPANADVVARMRVPRTD
jgi:mutator protein MutT